MKQEIPKQKSFFRCPMRGYETLHAVTTNSDFNSNTMNHDRFKKSGLAFFQERKTEREEIGWGKKVRDERSSQ